MPIYSRSYFTATTEQAEIPARTSAVLRAQAGLAFEESPLPSIRRLLELDVTRKRLAWAYRQYDAREAEAFMAANGLAGQFTFENRPYSQLELSILAKRKRRELKRAEILSRAAGGISQGAARLGTSLGVSLLDPINVAASFIPIAGPARYARALEAAGGLLGRTAVRAGFGAAEGVAGAALVEPLIYAARVDEQADYSMADSLANIAFGGVFGATLHSGAGLVGDLWRSAYSPSVRETETGIDYREHPAPVVQWATPAQSFQGATQSVRISDRYVPIRWAVMEADDLRATLERAENQYRDRNRAAGQAQIRAIAANLDFNLLGHSPIMDFGAPTLTADGAVVGGNGRLAAIQLAYNQGNGIRYRDPLVQQAAQFGLSPQAVAAMRKPVLVRVLAEQVDTRQAAIASNEGGAMRMSALEQAQVDAERLGDLRAFKINEDGSVSIAQSAGAVRRWVNEMPDTQRAALLSADGRLSAEGLTRLRNAILHRAFGDSPTLTRLIEAVDPGSRNVAAALTRTAGRIAELRDSIAAGDRFDLDLSGELRDAVETLNRVRDSGQVLEEFLAQGELIDSGLSPAAREVLAFMGAHIRSSKAIADFIERYYDAVDALGSPKQAGLFGTPEAPDKAALIRQAAGDYIPSAAERVEMAPVEVQQAAARVAVAQAVEGQAINVEPLIEGDPRALIAAAEQADAPDGKPLNDPVAAEQIDALAREIPQTDQAELAAAEKALAETELELTDTVRDLQGAGVLPRAAEARVKVDMFGGEERYTVPDDSPLLKSHNQDTSPERVAMRQDILDAVLAKAKPSDAPVVYMMGGGGGAGKSTILRTLRDRGEVPQDTPILNADDFKEAIPEYQALLEAGDTRAAAVVHEESSLLLKQAIDGYLERKASFVLDGTMGNAQRTAQQLERFKAAGYRVVLIGVATDPIAAGRRAAARAKRSGRYVPPREFLKAHKGFANAWDDYVKQADEALIFDNSGSTPIEVARGRDGALAVVEPEAYNRFRKVGEINEQGETLADVSGTRADQPSRDVADSRAVGGTAATGGGAGGSRVGAADEGRREAAELPALRETLPPEVTAQLPPELQAEAAEVAAFAADAERLAEVARLASICATRSAA